ncbi:MAG TPA: iron ABC transporter permease [Chloroflexus aurantiacus]|jgi:iron complex transport system permease protein|uniref:Transport system permease protein n=1 Tax=Chloroflexus aurantiacus (strain ATCC 29366 / DSM 635 / J-10-fl) TaxID=324602 RepID=A9WCP6_CHLAA|nr:MULTISPECIES: iron ABC transporter permease [Chloroflexus]ABY37008.1 transport system permease protein [Chloroflexus aurantiacus J-10-fl]RMG47751.1 MAG: iron ABC transporter permease [Chloroflexota bacterium]HBW65834.1 iron ABC transporter permease [Chloroflexus aurantiacus]
MATVAANTSSTQTISIKRSRQMLLLGLPVCAIILGLALLSSIAFGAADIAPNDVWQALIAFNPASTEHLIIRTLRVPRAAVAALVGAALAVAGALMQGLTRNPLADPGILGIETGAALGVVSAVFFLKIGSLYLYALFAFTGAALTALAVYALGSIGRGGPTPLKITIAGAALTALLSSFTTGILIFNQRTLEEVRFWLAGSVAGRDLNLLAQASPYLICGLLLALALGRQITTISLGDEIAKGLGQRTGWVKLLTAIATVLLAGASVAVAGPIGFVGLVIPHAVRFLVGVDYRWILPYAALIGATFLVLSDVAARLIIRPTELPVGVMTALIGGPFFVYLVRWRVKR